MHRLYLASAILLLAVFWCLGQGSTHAPLCGEEYLFFSEGYIHREVWRAWCAGRLWYFQREPFRSMWEEENATNSYYGLSLDVI
jgi:hypothetical protein